MINILHEYDEFDYSDYDDYSSDSEFFSYEIDYFTYYRDSNEMKIPVYEKELTSLDNLPSGWDEADMAAENIKRDIDAAVESGEYPGFYVHHICVELVSDSRRIDVDRYRGSTYVDEDASYFESDELPLPEDWDEDMPDYMELADVAYNYEN